MRPVLRAHAALLLCACIYSGWNITAARCLAVVSPITFSLVRELASIVVLYAWAALVEGPLRMPPPADRWRFVLLGFILAAFQLCFAVGVALAGPQTAAIFQCIEPSTAAVIGALVGAEPPTWAKALSAVLAGGGVLMMQLGSGAPGGTQGATQQAAGSALLFLQGVGISCYCLLQKTLVRGTPEPLELADVRPTEAHAEAGRAVPCAAGEAAGAEGGGSGRTEGQPLLARRARAHGAVTVTAHAYVSSLALMLVAAAVDAALRIESPSPPAWQASSRGPCPAAAAQ